MKTQLLTLLSIAALLTAISCNEKVSSEIKNAGASTGDPSGGSTGGTSGGTSGEQTFKVSLDLTGMINSGFKIHRTGFSYDAVTNTYTSRKTTDCQVTAPTGGSLSNALYDAEAGALHDDKSYDISCFVEAEELALYLNGLKFKVEASANACQTVGFRPFGYYSYMPGSSTTQYKTISCPSNFTSGVPAGDHNSLDCGQYRNLTTALADAFGNNNITTPQNETDLCRFDYSDQDGPNCDPGVINIYQYNYIEDTSAPGTLIVNSASPLSTRTIRCGGKVSNCVNGAIKKVTGGSTVSTNYTDIIYYNNPAEDGTVSQIYTLPPLIMDPKDYNSNRPYVNYRRDLANPNIDYVDGSLPRALAYLDAFNPASYPLLSPQDLSFNPNLMEYYAVNQAMDLSMSLPYVSGAAISGYSDALFYKSTPYASEPFMSLSPTSYYVHPFYSFYCYDNANEISARIRLVVREWDRKFADPTTSSQFDLMSDIYNNGNANLDNYNVDSYSTPYNNYPDWDDYLFMTRTSGTFDFGGPGSTLYAPKAGFMIQTSFPLDLYSGDTN